MGEAACLFKGTGGWRRGESGGWKGEEREEAGTLLSNISRRAQRRQLRHSEEDGANASPFPPPPSRIIPSLSFQSGGLFIAPFHRQMSCGNIPSLHRG